MRKIIAAVVLTLVILGGTGYLGLKGFIIYKINKPVSKETHPNLYITPVSRHMLSAALPLPDSTPIIQPPFQLNVPWTIERKYDMENGTTYLFQEKRVVSVESKLHESPIVDAFLTSPSGKSVPVEELMGEENLRSDFNFVRLCLNTTPDQASLFTPLGRLMQMAPLLVMRAAYEPLGKSITEIHLANNLKGFQFSHAGDVDTKTIHLFDDHRQVLELVFMAATQEEVDLILSSIRYTP